MQMNVLRKTLCTHRGQHQAVGCGLPMAVAVILANVFKQNYGGRGDARVLGAIGI